MKKEILRLEQVTVRKDGVTLLNHCNLHLFQGEITGLVCLNTVGRESLLELIRRNLPIHYGRIYYNGELINHYQHSPLTMNKVAIIRRKCSLIESLTVADNIFVLRRGLKKFLIDKRTLNRQLKRFTKELNIHIDGDTLVSDLTPYEKCVVELLRAVILETKLIVIQDISNTISAAELSRFHQLMRVFCDRGLSVLYICNHHEEAFKICDRMCLMRDGRIIKKLDQIDFHHDKIAPYYIRQYERLVKDKLESIHTKRMLSFINVSTQNLNDVSFDITAGECTVLWDKHNTVLSDIWNLLKGEIQPVSGRIVLEDVRYDTTVMRKPIVHGVTFIQENPIETMLFKEMTYLQNLCFLIDQKQGTFRITKRMVRSIIREYEPLLGPDIHASHIVGLRAESLYNLVYYRIYLFNPKLVVCVQPFAGADMYLRFHIAKLIQQFKRKGIAVLILSVNIADSLVVADKMILLEDGRRIAEYDRSEFGYFQSESAIIPKPK